MGEYGAIFPGQGSQYPGMAKPLVENFTWTRELYEEASDAIKMDVLKLSLEGPEDALQLTANSQPAILTTSYAWFQVLRRSVDFRPKAAAGHSLGEYTALLAAGALTLTDAVKLVRRRGELMQDAVPPGKGKMAAVLGLDEAPLRALCEEASQGPQSIVVPANFNSPGQVVVAGHADAVDRAEALSADPRYKARKFIPLKVSAPFHSPLMLPAAEKFLPALKAIAWKDERLFPVVHNVDAKERAEGDVVELLKTQMDHPVLWTQCQTALAARGLEFFFEPGPGKVLTGLGKRIADNAKFFALDSIDDLKKIETAFQENGL